MQRRGDRRGLRQSGSAIVYAMLFAGIASAAISHFVRMSEQSSQLTQGDKLKTERDKLRRRLQTMAGLDDAMFRSSLVPVNSDLKNCLELHTKLPKPNVTCSAYEATNRRVFNLYPPESAGTQLTSIEPLPNLAGKYDHRGDPCIDPAKCIFQAISVFWIECESSSSSSSCQDSEYTIRTLVQVKTIGKLEKLGRTGDVPKDSDIATVKGLKEWANKSALSHIAKVRSPCSPGEVAVAATEGGVRCVSINNAGTCAANQLLMGVDSLGNPKCQNVAGNAAGACVSGATYGSYECTSSGCRQTRRVAVDCGKSPVTGYPARLVRLEPQITGCQQVGAAGKKSSPNDIGTYRCDVRYDYNCCP